MARVLGASPAFRALIAAVDHRDEKAQRLPRSCACRDDETPIAEGIADSLLLVLAEPERTVPAAPGSREIPKHLRAFRFQVARVDEVLNRATVSKVRVQLNERLGPEPPGCIEFVDLCVQLRRADLGKRARECLVTINDGFIEIEYVHHVPSVQAVHAGRVSMVVDLFLSGRCADNSVHATGQVRLLPCGMARALAIGFPSDLPFAQALR